MTNEDLKEYVVRNIDLAIKEGHIVPFFQPVVRAVTQKLCGYEALARWIDPDYGMISPGLFVPALESAGYIYKLDFHIVECICKTYVNRKNNDQYNIPVSFNLSRQDFEDHDVLYVIENLVKKYNVPRSMLNIEITESIIGKNPEYMQQEIKKLKNAGYEIWMDDFGSEYSSFNVLKDYEFDELKLDMKFISSENLKSRKIIMSIVDMAKKIGIKTLAEGVETHSQFEFLRNIGCEKIQGYYFGKPMSEADSNCFMDEYIYGIELPFLNKYYDDICSLNVLSPVPLGQYNIDEYDELGFNSQIPITIAEIKNGNIDFIFNNLSFESQLSDFGIKNMEILEMIVKDKESSYYKKIMGICNQADRLKGSFASGNFIIDESLCVARVCKIAEYRDVKAYACIIINMMSNDDYLNKISKDKSLQSIIGKYDRIDMFDLNTGCNTELYVNDQNLYSYDGGEFKNNIEKYIVEKVYYEDVDRYLAFYDMTTLRKRIEESKENIITTYIRTKENDEYIWKVFECNYIGNNRVVSTSRNASYSELMFAPNKISHEEITNVNNQEIILNKVNPEVICYWKDKNLRFLAATKGFMKFYNFKDISEIIGKKASDFNWVINQDIIQLEQKVLYSGKKESIDTDIISIGGKQRRVVFDMTPVYENGKVSSVMVYMIEASHNLSEKEKGIFFDEYTGLFNARGLMGEMNKYSDEFLFNNLKFAVMVLDVKDFKYTNKNYGNEFIREIIRTVGDILKKVISVSGVVGRMETDHFVILTRYEREGELLLLKEKILEEINKINKIADKSFTIDAYIEYTTCLEAESAEGIVGNCFKKIEQKKYENRNGE